MIKIPAITEEAKEKLILILNEVDKNTTVLYKNKKKIETEYDKFFKYFGEKSTKILQV